jgi:hypothetical protein
MGGLLFDIVLREKGCEGGGSIAWVKRLYAKGSLLIVFLDLRCWFFWCRPWRSLGFGLGRLVA